MKTKWKDAPLIHKIVTVVSIIVALAVIVLAILQMFDIWTQAINLDFVIRIREFPKNKKGKKKSVVLD